MPPLPPAPVLVAALAGTATVAVSRSAQLLLLALVAYNLVTSLWAWRVPPAARPGPRLRGFRVVVPAHDEARVLPGLLEDLARQCYPHDRYRVVVLADRCRDDTVAVATPLAEVAVRDEGPAGKGAALAWLLAREPLRRDEVLVVLDADNRVPAGLLARFADELDAGADVLQAYLDVVNPDGSPVATASALTYWAGNRMVQLARRNLGWSADLGGTGMCLTAPALRAAGGFSASLTDDQDLAARLVLAGRRVVWLHDLRIHDEKPEGMRAALRQRTRWMRGKRDVARRYGPALLARTARTRSLGPADQALRLVQPGRSFVALMSGLLALTAVGSRSPLLLPAGVWGPAAALQLLAPVAFLRREGVAGRHLLRYPFVVLVALLWLPARVLSRHARGWYHTPHRGREDEPPGVSSAPPRAPAGTPAPRREGHAEVRARAAVRRPARSRSPRA